MIIAFPVLIGWIQDIQHSCLIIMCHTQQEALPDASATYDPAYINQFVDFINFIQTQNSNYSIDIYLDLNIISQTPSEARAIVDYLRDGDINGVTDITVAGVELSNEVYFNWARDLAGFALLMITGHMLLVMSLGAIIPMTLVCSHISLQ